MTQLITKASQSRFDILWTEKPEEKLTVDFTPLIKAFRLSGNFCLLHWQAKPKGLRRFGVYDGREDNYVGVDYDKLSITAIPRSIQIDENLYATVPTAVLLFAGCVLIENPNGSMRIK